MLCCVVFVTFKIVLPILTKHEKTLIMPNILGLDQDEAEKILEENQLNYKVIDNKNYTFSYPAGTVVEQNPIANSVIKHGRTVYVKKNPDHPPYVKVPKLIDKSVRNVYSIVNSIGVKIGKIFYVTDIADNVIINAFIGSKTLQDNEKIPLGSTIDLVVGVNNLETEIPSFIGLNENEIELRLLEQKLKLGKIKYLQNYTEGLGIVVGQSDIAKHVKCGTVINIEIDSKKEEIKEENTDDEEENDDFDGE